jgi:hypothetical protein
VAAALGLIYAAGPGTAGEDSKEIRDAVLKIAAKIKAGDMAGAKSMAAAAKKYDLEDVMSLFKPKKKGGLGWPGCKPTDGIELKIREVARDGDPGAAKHAAMYEYIGNVTAAIGLIAETNPQGKDSGKKLRKNWLEWAGDVQKGGQKLTKTSAPADAKATITKINNACNACHSDFRQ